MKNTEKLSISGYIGPDDPLAAMFGMEEDNFSLKDWNNFQNSLPEGVEEIVIEINSGGGLCTEGWTIADKINALKETKGIHITTVGEGIVGSIATAIFNTGDTRKIYKNSDYYVHFPYVDPWAIGPLEAADALKLHDELQKEENKLVSHYTEITGKSREELEPYMKKPGTALTSEQALDLGFVTEIIGKDTSAKKAYRLVADVTTSRAVIQNHLKTKNNAMNKEEMKAWFQKVENMIKNFGKATVKAETATAEDGTVMYYEGELAKGTKVFADEAMTEPTPDGSYTVGDQTVTVAGGEVTEIADAAAETEALKKANEEIVALKAQLANEKKAAAEAAKNTASEIEALRNEVSAMKKVFGEDEPPKGGQGFKGTPAKATKGPDLSKASTLVQNAAKLAR